MEPDRDYIADRMIRFGLGEAEARALYHLAQAEDIFDALYSSEPGLATEVRKEIYIRSHFDALRKQLALLVIQRDYPEGWGRGPSAEPEDG
jgi:hypothetical protein